jgi:LmbE family N-acetylglucosaminyl deacetylase
MRLGTVLSVWAHPDDETYLASGLMAQAVRDGDRVVCVTATRGEGGSFDEERWPSDTLGAVREGELMACLSMLGVTEHEFLDLPDIDMATPLPETHGPDRIRELMRELQPDTVLTFGPEGMTGHEAHKSVSRWVTDAFHLVGKPGARLGYAAYTSDWADRFVPRMRDLGVFLPGTPVVRDRDELGLVLDLPDDLLDLKVAALKEHASQVEGVLSVFGEDELRDAMAQESYVVTRRSATGALGS